MSRRPPHPPQAPLPPRPPRTWSIAGFPLPGLLPFSGLIVVGAFGVVLVLALAIATWRDLDSSVWEQATGLVRLYALFWIAWLIYAYLPTYVAHGVTRREFMAKTVVFVVAQAGMLAGLVTLGYLAERLVFELAGWPHRLTGDHAFGSPSDVATVFLAYGATFLVWGSVAAFGAAGFYRDGGAWGLVALPVGLLLVLPTDLAVSSGGPPFLDLAFDIDDGRLAVAVALCLASAAVALAAAWALVRDMPIRGKAPAA
jgi:hypothetical protein